MDASTFAHQLLRPHRPAQRLITHSDGPGMLQGYDCLVHPRVTATVPPVLTVGGAYSGALRAAILEWKEAGWSADGALFADMILEAVHLLPLRPHPASRYLLTPVPTSRRTRVTRGGDLIWQLTRAAASASGDLCLVSRRLLRRRRSQDQVGLSALERVDNALCSYRARSRVASADPVILVDDVVTTGATLSACAIALRHHGWQVVGAVVLCGTEVRRCQAPRG